MNANNTKTNLFIFFEQMAPLPEEPEQSAITKKVSGVIDKVSLGVAAYNFLLAKDGDPKGGPILSTRSFNPREATKGSLKELSDQFNAAGGMVKDRVEFAIYMGVRRSHIVNLEELQNYQVGSGSPLPRIVWDPSVGDKKVELLNGNHRYCLMAQQYAKQLEQYKEVLAREKTYKKHTTNQRPHTRKETEQHKIDGDLENELFNLLEKEGLFSVKLYDLGE